MYRCKIISSLNKVFASKEPADDLTDIQLSAFAGEGVSFQIAYYCDGEEDKNVHKARLTVKTALPVELRVREIVLMPSHFPCSMERDEDYLDTNPGMYPDLLRELSLDRVPVVPGQWRSLWVEVLPEQGAAYSSEPVHVIFEQDGNILMEESIAVAVYPGGLQEQSVKHTEWFHADCLADYYQVPVWSKEHWDILEKFFKVYAKRGMNMLLTPIFTPSLDIAEGGERTTAQLIDVYVDNGEYRFCFDKLVRWFGLARQCGIRYFEMAHLYTQWGAKCAPKIVGIRDGREEIIFGWQTRGDDPKYGWFLQLFLKELLAVCKAEGVDDCISFHISDEPSEEDIDTYLKAKRQVEEVLKGYPIMDALSRYEFYESKAVDHPIPANDHMDAFLGKGIEGLWTYYCSGQKTKVSNRFFCMSLARTRIIGVQMYQFDIKGFLHWGFNFYNSQYSLVHLSPYEVTDADGHFPSGDSFLVYPGKDGEPEESIRLMAMQEAMGDIRALRELEDLSSREEVLALIQEGVKEPITFTEYPRDAVYLLKLREKVNSRINLLRGNH